MYKIDEIISIANNAGKAILEIYSNNSEESINISYKNDNSPLTAADKASNDIICKELERISQNIPILSEEGKHTDFEKRKNPGV